jgi:hypothetical protein
VHKCSHILTSTPEIHRRRFMAHGRYRGIGYFSMCPFTILFFVFVVYVLIVNHYFRYVVYSHMQVFMLHSNPKGPRKGKMVTSLYRIPRVRKQGSKRAIQIGRYVISSSPCRRPTNLTGSRVRSGIAEALVLNTKTTENKKTRKVRELG